MDLENSEIKLPAVDEVWVNKVTRVSSVVTFVFITDAQSTIIRYKEYLYNYSDGIERFISKLNLCLEYVTNIQWFLNNYEFDQKLTNDFIIKGIIE